MDLVHIVLAQVAVVVGSDYHLYQVLGDTGIGLGDDGDPRMLRREFGSATEGRFFAVFFLKI